MMSARSAAAADIMPNEAAAIPYTGASAFDWTGLYLGGHIGYAWGNSIWTASSPAGTGGSVSGSLNFSQGVDNFSEAGSWFEGLQAGYNRMLANRIVLGAEADFTAPAYQNLSGLSTGGSTTLPSGASYSDTLLESGTVRARIGYAPGNWLFYATGGFAWTFDELTLTQASGASATKYMGRTGWAAGAGVEFPISGHWTGKAEYLFTDYGSSAPNPVTFGQRINSDLSLQEARVGLNYQLGNSVIADGDPAAPAVPALDNISLHGQFTAVEQAYPAFHSPYPAGPQSLPNGGMGRETTDLTLYAGMRLWQGAEFWVDPEIDQGEGVDDAHGLAGFPSAESYKLGWDWPYARVQRYLLRQTIELGGQSQNVDADINQYASSTTTDRLVLMVGRFQVIDLFDTNKYANNVKNDFLNWASVNTGSFDYAGDAWAFTYGAAAELYKGPYTFRAGVFDMSQTPASTGTYGAPGWAADPDFGNIELIGEIEQRHELWGQPGKLKLAGYVIAGQQGDFSEAVALFNAHGGTAPTSTDTAADYWMNASRAYRLAPGVNFNMEQQVTDVVGVFARAGWCDGRYELWNNTDVDYSGQVGVSINGKQWGRPGDTVGVAALINGISNAQAAWLNAGGLGIIIGDGQGNLPHPGLEKIIETYYNYALTSSTKVSIDYQFFDNPAYNTDKGPVNLFAGRFHWQF